MKSRELLRRIFEPLAVCYMAVLLASCAGKPILDAVDNPQAVWMENSQKLTEVSAWSLTGRASVKVGAEGWNMNLTWKQTGENYQIDLFGPLGMGRVKLIGQSGAVSLQRGSDDVLNAADPESLMQQELGWSLPVNGMRYWVMGLAGPNSQSKPSLNRDGTLRNLLQKGWNIHFDRYKKLDSVSLPGRVRLNNGALRLGLVIDNWKLERLSHRDKKEGAPG